MYAIRSYYVIPKYTLKKLLEAAQKFNTDLVRGRMMIISEDCKLEQLPEEDHKKNKLYFYKNPLTDYYRHIRHKNKRWYYVWMCLFKKSVLQNVRFHDHLRAGGEDFLFVITSYSIHYTKLYDEQAKDTIPVRRGSGVNAQD